MKTLELEEIRLEQQILKKKMDALVEREKEVNKRIRESKQLTADEALLKGDVSAVEVNYVLSYYAGYKSGVDAAMNTIVESLASQYRDIPITEDELYMVGELGRLQHQAWLKSYKPMEAARNSGWDQDYFAKNPIWKRKEEKKENED